MNKEQLREQQLMEQIPDELVSNIRTGKTTITQSMKDEARVRKENATATSPENFMEMLGCGEDSYFSDRKAALLAFAARQPGSIDKLPDEWVTQWKEDMTWPTNHELESAKKAGEEIRKYKFIRLPGCG